MSINIHSPLAQGLAFGTGVFLHVSVYRRGEWDLIVPKLLSAYVVLFIGAVGWTQQKLNFQHQESLSSVIRAWAWLSACHAVGIILSMGVYRLLFHRLRAFPGPFWAKVTNVYHTVLTAKKLHLFEEVEILHNQYGDFVRIGPSELSIIDPSAIDAIYSAKSPCTKGPWYNILHPRIALNMIRDKKEHTRRRRVWDRGFNARALRDYEPRVINYTDQLLAQIQATTGRPLDVNDWFNFYSFDVMGDLAFGKSFNMLKDGVKHYFMKCLHADLTNVGYLSHLPWMFPFLKITPILNSEHRKFWRFCEKQVSERRQMKPGRPDVFSWLLEDFESGPQTAQKKLNLEGDAYLIVVAGSDTTAVTLTNIFFELVRNQNTMTSLRSELDEYFKMRKEAQEAIDSISLSKLSYLDAVINEALRLHPAVPSGLQRETPAEGLLVGNTFVPGNTIVQVPLHTVFRDRRFFEQPLEFIPERWTTRPELTKNATVFTPFSSGLYSCIGKQLSLMEMRYVISQIVYRFDVCFAPGQGQAEYLEGKRDAFTLALGPLNLVFTDRA